MVVLVLNTTRAKFISLLISCGDLNCFQNAVLTSTDKGPVKKSEKDEGEWSCIVS